MKKFNHLNIPDGWKQYWSRYPQGYTIIEALINWVSQVDDMVDNQNKLTDNVKNFRNELDIFIDQFDTSLQGTVTDTLSDWQASGFLDIVIDQALETKYHEMDNRLSSELAENTTKIDGRTSISIHEFEEYADKKNTLDKEKWDWSPAFQQAYDYIVSGGTGGKIMLSNNKYIFDTPPNIYHRQYYDNEGNESNSRVHGGALANIEIVGQGMDRTFIVAGDENTDGIFQPLGDSEENRTLFNITIKDMSLVGNNHTGTSIVFSRTTQPYYMFYKKVRFTKFDYGFYYERSMGYGFTNFTDCFFENNRIGFMVGGDNTVFVNCTSQRNLSFGGEFVTLNACNFIGGKVQYNASDEQMEQLRFTNARNVNFKGTYFEPTYSNTTELNSGRSMFLFSNFGGQKTENTTFDGCYINGSRMTWIARFAGDDDGLSSNISFTNNHIRNLKLGGGRNLFNGSSNTHVKNIMFGASNKVTSTQDMNGEDFNAWQLTARTDTSTTTLSDIYTVENELNGGNITKIVGSVHSSGTQRLFGNSFEVEQLDDGGVAYKITLGVANKGTSGGNTKYFPIIVTPYDSMGLIPQITRIDEKSFRVRFRDVDNKIAESGFSFEATISY